ncbi:hypothetical protein [Cyclobacterium salsum]|uniref:hypothetical protein n=1 Tax=Cyclobacterium salsum TaxID=2666329 RepID=UPI0013916F96|nr:hypothetical protein [Cyclobacterium salsum]
MKNSVHLISESSIVVLFILIVSCSHSKKGDNNNSLAGITSLQLKDSILVNYLEELTLMDASENFSEFLALNKKTDEVVIFNNDGIIVNSFENRKDSPDAVNNIFSLSFTKSNEIILGASPSIFAIYDRGGNQLIKNKFSSLFPRGSSIVQKQLFNTEENKVLGHLHAYPDSSFSNGIIKPTLLLIDPEAISEPKPMPKIPAKSKYSDGKFHGYVFPILNYFRGKLMLAYSNDPRLYVYNYQNEELYLSETIDLDIYDFVEIVSSSDEKSFDFDNNYREMKPGMIWGILSNDRNIFVMYAKGISETRFDGELHFKITKESIESNPMYLMVLDKNLKIVQKDIAIPYFILDGFKSVSDKGVFIGRKSPIFSDIEANHEIFYTFEIDR